jgi:crotonobetaine/carnitine-CoA ligase
MDERSRLAERFHWAGLDIPAQLDYWARQRGDHPFLIWEPETGADRTWTYSAFWNDARRIAAGLAARGIGRGERVLIHSDNCPEMLLAWYACAIAGAIAVTTNTGSVKAELARAARHAGVRAAITQAPYAALVADAVPGVEWLAVISGEDGGASTPAGATRIEPVEALYGKADAAPTRAPEPLLPAGILYTSGTTSTPKAVVHSHANVLWAGQSGMRAIEFSGDDVHLAYLPLFHTNAQLWSAAVALGAGGSVVLLPRPTLQRFWIVVEKHRVTHVSATGHLLRNAPERRAGHRHSLKVVQSGALSPALRGFATRAGAQPIAAYGMSETVTYTLHTSLRQSWPDGCMGRPAAGYEVKVVNAGGEPCASEEPGELLVRGVRGVQLFLGYFGNPEANEQAFTADGWFRTGDIVKVAADGALRYLDRDKDRIRVGGENVSAGEVEAVITGVAGVMEAAVVARSHSRLESIPVAFVLRRPGAPDDETLRSEIAQRCAQRLSPFKRPRAVLFVEELPRALLDKVAKARLRERAELIPDDQVGSG